MVTTAPALRLSSMVMRPWEKERYSLTRGSPLPTPRMYRFMGSVAEENPGIWAFSFWECRALVGEPDGVSSVIYRNDDFAESGMNEVLATSLITV